MFKTLREYHRLFGRRGFLRGDLLRSGLGVEDGLFMLQPHVPGRIPVVLVHGTASSPARWAEMLNDLKSDPVLTNRYEAWLFMYTTGNPILYSASLLQHSLRSALAERASCAQQEIEAEVLRSGLFELDLDDDQVALSALARAMVA